MWFDSGEQVTCPGLVFYCDWSSTAMYLIISPGPCFISNFSRFSSLKQVSYEAAEDLLASRFLGHRGALVAVNNEFPSRESKYDKP